ncbi:hypothetical protein C3L33_23401, partial [Rhododendron williamsianum]
MLTSPWQNVAEWFQSDDPTRLDGSREDVLGTRGQRSAALQRGDGQRLPAGCERDVSRTARGFSGLNSLVDVVGLTGTVAKALAYAFPELECTVLDLPHVVADLRGSGNLKFVGGDMLKAIPSADAVLLKWILHDWSDEESVKILKRCKEALPSRGGKVIIIDIKVENDKEGDDESTETQLFWDMLMMIVVMGEGENRERLGEALHQCRLQRL